MKKRRMFQLIFDVLIITTLLFGCTSETKRQIETPKPTPELGQKSPEPTQKPTETTKPVETLMPSKVTFDEAKGMAIFGQKTELYDNLKFANVAEGLTVLAGNFPEGTKIYAPFDGYVHLSFTQIGEEKVKSFDIWFNNNRMASLNIIANEWSDSIGKGNVKKGDYIGTIGKSKPIFDDSSSSKGNNVFFMPMINGFVSSKYNNIKDYIKDLIRIAETSEVKKKDMP